MRVSPVQNGIAALVPVIGPYLYLTGRLEHVPCAGELCHCSECTVQWSGNCVLLLQLPCSVAVLLSAFLAKERLNTWLIYFGAHCFCSVIVIFLVVARQNIKTWEGLRSHKLPSSGLSVLWEPQLCPDAFGYVEK